MYGDAWPDDAQRAWVEDSRWHEVDGEAALLVDYVLTVSVSVVAGIAALTSAYPALYHNRVLLAVIAVAIIAWGNLRGIRESGTLFALPLYAYLVCWFAVLAFGFYQYLSGVTPAYVPPSDAGEPLAGVRIEYAGIDFFAKTSSSNAALAGPDSPATARASMISPSSCIAPAFLPPIRPE